MNEIPDWLRRLHEQGQDPLSFQGPMTHAHDPSQDPGVDVRLGLARMDPQPLIGQAVMHDDPDREANFARQDAGAQQHFADMDADYEMRNQAYMQDRYGHRDAPQMAEADPAHLAWQEIEQEHDPRRMPRGGRY